MEHDGHRARMRQRFARTGLEGFADHEVLELLLFYAIPRRDVNPLAHRLLDTFGSLANVFEATPDQLMQVPGMGENAACLVSIIVPLFRHYNASVAQKRTYMLTRGDCIRYCTALMAGRKKEHFYIIGLDASYTVVGTALICTGDLSEVPAYPRQVMQAVMRINAQSVIFCHNHPGGNLLPSDDDESVTCMLIEALKTVNVQVLDHVIFSRGQCSFMSDSGRLPFYSSRTTPFAAEHYITGKDRLHVDPETQTEW